jgi:hypothetical protein
MRYVLPSGHIVEIYPKSGDSGSYSAFFVLVPDYDAGFSVNMAGTSVNRFELVAILADMIANSVVPALEAQAVAEAKTNLIGTYTSATTGLNSSLTLILNQTETDAPGLVISSWISNGTDVLSSLNVGPRPWRLVPTIRDPKGGKQAFRIVTATDAPSPQVPGQLFSGPGLETSDWVGVDSLTYGGIGIALFVFDIGTDGKATALSPAAFRTTLLRTD